MRYDTIYQHSTHYMARRRTRLIALAVSGAAVAACAGEPSVDEARTRTQLTARTGVTIYLADPELGVVGEYRSGGQILYFETASRPTAGPLSARLVDGAAHTISATGHNADAWLADDTYDVSTAAASRSLVTSLANQIGAALSDPIFASERAVLEQLSRQTVAAGSTTGPFVATLSLSVSPVSSADQKAFYDRAADNLHLTRLSDGSLEGTFLGIHVNAFAEQFADETDEEGLGPRDEQYARFAGSTGTTLVAQFGGDSLPLTWDMPAELDKSAPADVASTLPVDMGQAVLAAQALVKQSMNKTPASPDEIEALGRIGKTLRDDLLPTPLKPGDGVATAAIPSYRTDGYLWTKSLVASVIAQHSAMHDAHLFTTGGPWQLSHRHYFCNHGTCPGACSDSCMALICNIGNHPRGGTWLDPPIRTVPPGQTGAGQTHSCNTGYSLGSVRAHNCHDDSWTQIRYLKSEPASPDHNRCNDITPRRTAPSCSD